MTSEEFAGLRVGDRVYRVWGRPGRRKIRVRRVRLSPGRGVLCVVMFRTEWSMAVLDVWHLTRKEAGARLRQLNRSRRGW